MEVLPTALSVAIPSCCAALLVAWAFLDRWVLIGIGVLAVGLFVVLVITLCVAAAQGDRRMAERFGAPQPGPIGLVVPLLALQVEDAANRQDFPAGTEDARPMLQDALVELDGAAQVLARSPASPSRQLSDVRDAALSGASTASSTSEPKLRCAPCERSSPAEQASSGLTSSMACSRQGTR